MNTEQTCVSAIIDELERCHVSFEMDDVKYNMYHLRPCLQQMLTTDDAVIDARKHVLIGANLIDVVYDWFSCGVIDCQDNPVYKMLDRYWHEDWRGVIWTYLQSSNLLVYNRLLTEGQRACAVDECMYPFDYMPQDAVKRIATVLCFPTKDEYLVGVSGDYEDWICKLAKTGILSFAPHICESGYAGMVLAIKYNKVLRYNGQSFDLMNGDTVLLSSGRVPSLEELNENSCAYVLFMAALSVANYVSSFYTVENMRILSDYCIELFQNAGINVVSTDLYADTMRCFMQVQSSVTNGNRIVKTYAWDFARWRMTDRGYVIEVPTKNECETYQVYFGTTPLCNCIEKMLQPVDSGDFELITGVMAMLGIYLDSSRAWPIDTKLAMPAYNTHSFNIIRHL